MGRLGGALLSRQGDGGIAIFWKLDKVYLKADRATGLICGDSGGCIGTPTINRAAGGDLREQFRSSAQISLEATLYYLSNEFARLHYIRGGDFNVITGGQEKSGGAPFRFDWKALLNNGFSQLYLGFDRFGISGIPGNME